MRSKSAPGVVLRALAAERIADGSRLHPNVEHAIAGAFTSTSVCKPARQGWIRAEPTISRCPLQLRRPRVLRSYASPARSGHTREKTTTTRGIHRIWPARTRVSVHTCAPGHGACHAHQCVTQRRDDAALPLDCIARLELPNGLRKFILHRAAVNRRTHTYMRPLPKFAAARHRTAREMRQHRGRLEILFRWPACALPQHHP